MILQKKQKTNCKQKTNRDPQERSKTNKKLLEYDNYMYINTKKTIIFMHH